METPGIEPGTSHMQSERSSTELRPLRYTTELPRKYGLGTSGI